MSLDFPSRVTTVWVVVLIGIVIYCMAWYSMGYAIMEVIVATEASVTFEPPWNSVIPLLKIVVAWHPIISLAGWLAWGFACSMKRDVRTYEV